MKKLIVLTLLLAGVLSLRAQDRHIVLWDNTNAPTGSNGLTGPEQNPDSQKWDNTQVAEMWVYRAGGNATGQAVVFFPGGGYSQLSLPNGHKTAKWFASQGITAAVVKYRLPNGHAAIPLSDGEEALRRMRELAPELGFDPQQVGVAGTSAGGHLAASVGTMAAQKPNFMILLYPVISSDKAIRHDNSYICLLGPENIDTPLAAQYSPEKRVDATTPPALIFHCDDDPLVVPENATAFFNSLKAAGLKASLHIYPSGGHGWGMNDKFRYRDAWRSAATDWLQALQGK